MSAAELLRRIGAALCRQSAAMQVLAAVCAALGSIGDVSRLHPPLWRCMDKSCHSLGCAGPGDNACPQRLA